MASAIDWRKRLRELGLARERKRRGPGTAARKTVQQESGKAGEDLAAGYLEERGLGILARNARYPCGEIDIVARDAATLVFVEVKRRGGAGFGDPAEAVTLQKQERVRAAALLWMRENPGTYPGGIRFDVISIEDATHRIDWLKGAFDGHS